MKQKRNLYRKNTPVEEALEKFYEAFSFTLQNDIISVKKSLGCILSEPVFSKVFSPNIDSCAMDGIAVISEKTKFASESNHVTLIEGIDYKQVNTGNPLIKPFDAVIMAEDIIEDENKVVIKKPVLPFQHVRPIGEDLKEGELIASANQKIRAFDIGAMLTGGVSKVVVKKQPLVAIIPTGSELVDVDATIKTGQVVESNSYMLEALVKENNGIANKYEKVKDDYETIKSTIKDAAKNHDLVLVCAGTSAGTEDYSLNVIKELGHVIIHGLSIKPGKPVILGVIENTPIIGVPGYPVSAYTTFESVITPVLEKMSDTKIIKKTVKATLERRIVSSFKHKEHIRVKLSEKNGKLIATPLSKQVGSAMSIVRSDGLLVIPLLTEGIEEGEEVEIILY